jgi:TolB-like protein
MPSLMPGYDYDIFISYRQKDNKGDRWVSEFVEALRTELESTFKEEISVYFDINPHDGLLETHDVDASLKDKLKCLVFIPIISRTYCDPKSFAWEHEFRAFVELASHDQYGLKVKLPNGNVASRVLPIRIHELDPDDIKLFESIFGGVLRGIEFIYKESGFNRPLKPDDDEKINLNKTKYRNQIAKVALAIKEIISSLGYSGQKSGEVLKEVSKPIPVSWKNGRTKILAISIIALALIILGSFLLPILLNPKIQIDKSIAVLPFVNDSPDQENSYFINGIMEEILNDLQKIEGFRVLSRTSTEQFRGASKPSIPEIAKKLDVNFIIEGSGQKYGKTIRLRVQLISAKNESHLWAKSYEQEINKVNDIFNIQSQIAQAIATELQAVITPQEKQLIEKTPTDNLEAYRLYMLGISLMTQWNEDAYRKAIDYYHQAIALDSGFAQPYAGLASAYYELSSWDVAVPSSDFIQQSRDWALKALKINKDLAEAYFVIGSIKYIHEWDWNGAEENFKKGMELNPNFVYGRLNYANFLTAMGRFKESITIGQQSMKLSPLDPGVYNELAFAMFFDGQEEKALELTHKSLELNPNFSQTVGLLVQFYAWKGHFDQAMLNWRKLMSLNDDDIHKISVFYLGSIGQAFGVAGRRTEVIPFLNELKRRAEKGDYVPKTDFAFLYQALGETEKAIEFFEKGLNEKETPMVWINVFYRNDSIRSNNQFKQLLREMKFIE